MTWILSIIGMTSIWVLGLTISTQSKMIFYFVRKWADTKTNISYEAIIKCPWCMPSLHSAIGYLFCHYTGIITFEWKMLIAYPIIVCGSSIVSGLVWTIYLKIEAQRAYFTNVEQLSHFDIKDRKDNFQRNYKKN